MAEAARKQDLVVTLTLEQLEGMMMKTFKRALASVSEEDVKEVVGFKEVCKLLDASAPTVRRWVRLDGLPYVKLGGRSGGKILKFRRTEVLAWLDARKP